MITVEPIFKREAVDAARPTAKKLASGAGWAVSGGSDILLVWQIANHVWSASQRQPAPVWLAGLALAGGLLLFAILTAGQIFTIGRSRWGYRVFLIIDLAISAWGIAPALAWFSGFFVSPDAARVLAGMLSSGIGLASAKLPELFMFGDLREATNE